MNLDGPRFDPKYYEGAINAFRAELKNAKEAVASLGEGRVRQWILAAETIADLVEEVKTLRQRVSELEEQASRPEWEED
jgi:hypothetical protein